MPKFFQRSISADGALTYCHSYWSTLKDYLTIEPRMSGTVSIWNVRRQPSLSTSEPQLRLPIKAPAINMLTTSPSRIELPSKPSSRAMETIGPFITLQRRHWNIVKMEHQIDDHNILTSTRIQHTDAQIYCLIKDSLDITHNNSQHEIYKTCRRLNSHFTIAWCWKISCLPHNSIFIIDISMIRQLWFTWPTPPSIPGRLSKEQNSSSTYWQRNNRGGFSPQRSKWPPFLHLYITKFITQLQVSAFTAESPNEHSSFSSLSITPILTAN